MLLLQKGDLALQHLGLLGVDADLTLVPLLECLDGLLQLFPEACTFLLGCPALFGQVGSSGRRLAVQLLHKLDLLPGLITCVPCACSFLLRSRELLSEGLDLTAELGQGCIRGLCGSRVCGLFCWLCGRCLSWSLCRERHRAHFRRRGRRRCACGRHGLGGRHGLSLFCPAAPEHLVPVIEGLGLGLRTWRAWGFARLLPKCFELLASRFPPVDQGT